MKKRVRVSPLIKTAVFVSVIVFLIGFSYNKANPIYGRIDNPTSTSDANTKNNSSIIYPNITKQTGQSEPSASPTIGSTLRPNMPSLPKFNSNIINKSSSQSTNISESENHVQNNIPGIQSGEGQEIDIEEEEEQALNPSQVQSLKANLVVPDSSPFKSDQCTPSGSLEKFVPNPFMKDLNTTRFIVGNCITVTGKVTWTHYINTDGDANFNVKPDSKYSSLLTPVNMNSQKLKGALHVEVVCQGKNTSTDPVKKNQCKDPKYNGPDFKGVLPTVGQHVEVTGIYVIDVREGGHAELHPAYHIKSIL
jgi:hypothetical protein